MSDYGYEYQYDEKYCYPNANILKNKLDIHNEEDLSSYEREITAVRQLELLNSPPKGEMNFLYLKKLHKMLFSEIYDWAGKVRTVNISKGNQFCMVQFIEDYANDVFRKLKDENYLMDCAEEDLPNRLAYYLAEINTIHPFREGNGRTQRLFVTLLANRIGYDLLFDLTTNQEMIEASDASFNLNFQPMEEIIKKILVKIEEKTR